MKIIKFKTARASQLKTTLNASLNIAVTLTRPLYLHQAVYDAADLRDLASMTVIAPRQTPFMIFAGSN